MRHSRHIIDAISALAFLAASAASTCLVAAAAEVWEGEPYHVHASLAIDAPGELADQLAAELPVYLNERANTAVGIVWRLKTEVASGPLRHQMLDGLKSITADNLGDTTPKEDKRLLLVVRATPWGYELSAREFDRYVQRWGTVVHRTTRQREAVPEQLFALVRQAISPLARIRPDSSNPQQMMLDLRGADLPRSGPDFSWANEGELFQPILRRTTRDGVLVPGGVTAVPWTYLEVIAPSGDGQQTVSRIRSATQRPLGPKRGRIEQVAIGLRNDPADVTLELRSRFEREKPLAGYEVLTQNVDEKLMQPIGTSDGNGEVTIPPGKSAVQTVFVKSDGVTLAALPVVPGLEPRVQIPLPDDSIRMRVAARLSSLREDMIDLVAQRNIFMARIRQQMEEQNLEVARKLFESLDDLPGQTQFNLILDRDSQELHTKDLPVQRRIDQLFAETRKALGKFLDPRPIRELQEELRQAEQAASEKKSKSGSDAKTS